MIDMAACAPGAVWKPRLLRLIATSAALSMLAACQADNKPVTQRPVSPPPRVNQVDLNPPQTPVKPLEPVAPLRNGPIRVALLAPLSGDFAEAGRELSNGAAMALFDTPGVQAEIMAFDTAGDAARANAAVLQAASQKADIITGPLFGLNAAGIADSLAAEGLVALAFSNDGSVAGQQVLVMGRTATAETARIIRHAAIDGARNIAVFGKSGSIGNAVVRQAIAEQTAQNGLRIQRALYAPDTSYTQIAKNVAALLRARSRDNSRSAATLLRARSRDNSRSAAAVCLQADLTAADNPEARLLALSANQPGAEGERFRELARLYTQMTGAGSTRKSAVAAVVGRYRSAGGLSRGRVDAVLLTLSGAELSTVAPMFQLYDACVAGVRLLGLSGWNDMDPTRARELHGGRYPSVPFSDAFDDRYQRAFGELPTELAGVAYDAVKLALSAADGSTARPLPAEVIAAAGKINGALGPVAMSAAGVALRPLEVLEMRPDGVFSVSAATIVDPSVPDVLQPVGAGS